MSITKFGSKFQAIKKFIIPVLFVMIFVFQVNAQPKSIFGKVYAFKDLPLNNVEVVAKKAKTSVLTDSLGYFRITCEQKDKLEFSGNGFQKTSIKIDNKNSSVQKMIKAKMIINEGVKNMQAAVSTGHVTEEKLNNSIQNFPEYNHNYYNYTDVFSAIKRIYAGNQNISVRENSVFVRKENSLFSASPAIFIIDGKLALEISDILMGNIEAIKIIPDGSARYGIRASSGVVIISTFKD